MEFVNVEGNNYELQSIPEDGVFSSITVNFNSAQRPTIKLQPPDFASMHLHATKETSSDPYTQIHAYAPSNSQSLVIDHCKGASLMTICSLCPEPCLVNDSIRLTATHKTLEPNHESDVICNLAVVGIYTIALLHVKLLAILNGCRLLS